MRFLIGVVNVVLLVFGSSSALAENERSLGEIPIEIKAKIIGETCQVLNEFPGDLLVDVGEVPLESIKSATSTMGYEHKLNDVKMTFKCTSGTRAKFTLKVASPECAEKTSSGWRYLCGGQNKSIGMMSEFSYLDTESGKKTVINGKADMDGNDIYNLKLDDSEGVISVVKVFMSKLRNTEPSPGDIASSYLLTLWAD
ncbi:Uncharacterised protein [Aeromonas salmonicida]|uniref:hypothetical protein n=1 Tax=Aeromonas salmonicida TaxID=645 RepID=UPI001027F1F6|nr:hypothetical protein [Aeromonas salmonicida]VFB10260.1 Uncharacterised protein [Aeromonas salmonicida]